MINPIHRQLPRIVLHIQATCKYFDHNHVLLQWLFFDALTEQHLDQFLVQQLEKVQMEIHVGESFTLHSPLPDEWRTFQTNFDRRQFPIECKKRRRISKGLSDQDYIHNHKKLDNNLDSPTRDIRLGNYPVHRNFIRLVTETFPRHIHGLRNEDVNKKDRMNWAAPQRTVFPCVRVCFRFKMEEHPFVSQMHWELLFF